jgi:hypothetical protein
MGSSSFFRMLSAGFEVNSRDSLIAGNCIRRQLIHVWSLPEIFTSAISFLAHPGNRFLIGQGCDRCQILFTLERYKPADGST